MKILELTTYTSGSCGVGARVKQEALLLSEKHEVKIFSTNFTKDSKEKALCEDRLEKVFIKRFPAIKLGGESFSFWKFKKEAIAFSPDIIIAHAYRHIHTTAALKIGKQLNIPVILVTHGPFDIEKGTRDILSSISVKFYDKLIGSRTLKKFSKIVIIAPWEKRFLKELNVPKDKIIYIPNGIPDSFFEKPIKIKEQNKILYFGRVSPIKYLETLIIAFSKIRSKSAILEIAGPAEPNYLSKLKDLTRQHSLEKRVVFTSAIYDLNKKIEKIDSAKIYVLPSRRETMPQALIEEMARKKIVIASNNLGSSSIIKNNKNGFLFSIGNSEELAEKIDFCLKKNNPKMKEQARKDVEKFAWSKIIKQIDKLINELVKN